MAGVLSLPLSKVFYGCFSLALSCWKVLQVKVLSSLTVEVKSTCSGNAPFLKKKKKFHASAAVEEYEGAGEISSLQKPVEELGWTRRSSKGSTVT